jgi:transposase
MLNKILALDLGKSKTAARIHCTDGRPDTASTIETTPQALHDLIVACGPTLVIIEACSIAWWVHDLVVALDVKVLVTANNGPGWKWRNIRNKSDRTDAAKLIKMYLSDQLEPVHVPDHEVRQWRGLIHQRHDLVADRTCCRNRITGLFAGHGVSLPGATPWTKKWLDQVRAHARAANECIGTELWRFRLKQDLEHLDLINNQVDQVEEVLAELAEKQQAVKMLQQEPGVGPRLAETLAAVIDNPLRFKSGKQVACYVGLTPRHWSSGQTERSGHISKQGNSLLRTLLVEVSWLGLRRNEWMKTIYETVKRGSPTRGKIAIVAVARRLLVKLWAKWRDFELGRQMAATA